MRTSKFAIFVRATIIVFVIYMGMALAWNSITLSNRFSIFEMAISAVLTVLFFGTFAWVIVRVGMALLYGRSSQYQSYRQSGGDPYFDSLPWPINPDSRIVRETGRSEPRTNFRPPRSWKYQCPLCGARVQHRIDVCWNCNYGADGDSSAYLQKEGEVKPPEITEEQWERVRRGEPINGPSASCVNDACFTSHDGGYDGWIPVDERPNPNA